MKITVEVTSAGQDPDADGVLNWVRTALSPIGAEVVKHKCPDRYQEGYEKISLVEAWNAFPPRMLQTDDECLFAFLEIQQERISREQSEAVRREVLKVMDEHRYAVEVEDEDIFEAWKRIRARYEGK